MSEEASFAAPQGGTIDINDAQDVQHWAKKLDATPQQITGAVHEVGAQASDVEAHLKGARSTTNAERTRRG